MSCLVIVDLQGDFLPPDGSLAIENGRTIVPMIANLMKLPWSGVVLTQDWHPKDHTSFASNHNVELFEQLPFKHPLGTLNATTNEPIVKLQTVWPDHCIQNSPGAAIEPTILRQFQSLSPEIPKTIVQKGYLSDCEYYLCFQDTWGIHHTNMKQFLLDHHFTKIVFVGLAYDYCVYWSAKDCAELGFTTYVISDCSKAVVPSDMVTIEERYRDANVNIIRSEDVDTILQAK
jgi:nicotinamidase